MTCKKKPCLVFRHLSKCGGTLLMQLLPNIVSKDHYVFVKDSIALSDEFPATGFVVGMMRSGSTLVESILSSHSKVWGAGEDSVFNGNLPAVRDRVVAAVATGKVSVLKKAVDRFAAEVEKGMYAKVPAAERRNVKFIVDKMLFNYRNIGFIHLLCKDGYAHLPN